MYLKFLLLSVEVLRTKILKVEKQISVLLSLLRLEISFLSILNSVLDGLKEEEEGHLHAFWNVEKLYFFVSLPLSSGTGRGMQLYLSLRTQGNEFVQGRSCASYISL